MRASEIRSDSLAVRMTGRTMLAIDQRELVAVGLAVF